VGLKYQYYGVFAPGLEGCIAEVLEERSAEMTIPLLLSGAAVFETSLSYDRLNFFCFNNIFLLISFTTGLLQNGGRPSGEMLENFVRNTIRLGAGKDVIAASAGAAGEGFRVIFSLENIPAALDGGLREKAEAYISSLSGLRVNRDRPGVEFWFLLRREGVFFLRRLSRHRPWDKLLHPGELPPPLAWMLCRLSNPGPGQRVADPFCGYGSIPAARLRHFPPAEFFASDIDRKALKTAKQKFKGKPRHCCRFNCLAAEELPRLIPPVSLDGIITDPPWGIFRKPAEQGSGPGDRSGAAEGGAYDPARLYNRSLAAFSGLLKGGAPAVMLCGRGEELKTAAEKNNFTVERNIPILLSGRKAAVYVLRNRE
jgi:hypothetical protein